MIGSMSELKRYISVDIETSGPNPHDYSLLSIGACTLVTPRQTFYIELIPTSDQATIEAMAVNQLSLQKLARQGLAPEEGMRQFEDWLAQVVLDQSPIFLAFNAPFDWMFVNDYFHRFRGYNPFGHTAIDIKSFYMATGGVTWSQTSMDHIARRYLGDRSLSHHALQDAIDQADIFLQMLLEAGFEDDPKT